MMQPFTFDELEALSEEVDRQLKEIDACSDTTFVRAGKSEPTDLAKRQLAAIAETTGEPPVAFLERFKEAARKDLCQSGGILYEQWARWKDLANKDALKLVGCVLAGMGLSGGTLQTVSVAIVVYLVYIGVQAFCAGVS